MRCFGKVADDLHDYFEVIAARGQELMREENVGPFLNVRTCECLVVHRDAKFQTEIIRIHPCAELPMHKHPHVDSIDFLLHGNIAQFAVGGKAIKKFVQRMGLRIPADSPHGGRASVEGVMFLSCQRWSEGTPSHIILDWRGTPITDLHYRWLEKLAPVS